MYTIIKAAKRFRFLAISIGITVLILGFLWLLFENPPPAAPANQKNTMQSVQLAFANTEQRDQARHIITEVSGLDGYGIDNLLLPLTDFTMIHMVPYSQILARLIPSDPRSSALLDIIPELFTFPVENTLWTKVLYPVEILDHFESIESVFSDLQIDWKHNIWYSVRTVKFWPLVLAFSLFFLLAYNPGRDFVFRLLLLSVWGIVSLLVPGYIAGLVSALGLFLASSLAAACPVRCLPSGRYACSFFNLKPWTHQAIPYLLIIIILCFLEPILFLIISLPIIANLFLLKFGHGIHRMDRFRYLHAPPAFVSLQKPLLNALLPYRTMLFLVITLILAGGIILNNQRKTDPARMIPAQAEIIEKKLAEAFEEHIFIQLALTEGILGSLDKATTSFQRAEPVYHDSKPLIIQLKTKTRSDYYKQIQQLQSLSKFDTLILMGTPKSAPRWPETEQNDQKAGKPLELQAYLPGIMILFFLVLQDVIRTRLAGWSKLKMEHRA